MFFFCYYVFFFKKPFDKQENTKQSISKYKSTSSVKKTIFSRNLHNRICCQFTDRSKFAFLNIKSYTKQHMNRTEKLST